MNHLVKTILTAGLMTLAIQTDAAPQSTDISPAEKTKIESIIHDYIAQNPEVLVQSLQTFQQRQYDQAQQTVKQTQQTAPTFAKALFHQANDPVAGNPNGNVTLVEFFDYQCPHCVDMAPVIESLIKTNPQLKIVFKEFPIRGPISEFAARAALAANVQGKYYVLNHALLTYNKPLTQEIILDVAKNSGLNVEKLKKDMDDASVSNQLKGTLKLAQDLKLFGTPAIFISNTTGASKSIDYIPGQLDQKQLQTLIDKAGK
jgi:protein-disulfide isomerase